MLARVIKMEIKFRDLTRSDLKEASFIIGDNYPDFDENKIIEELNSAFLPVRIKPRYLVAFEGNNIIGIGGYCQSYMDYGVYEIFWINVKKSMQGKGVGTQIVSKIIEVIKTNNGDDEPHMVLLTAAVSKRLPEFYASHFGFKVLENIDGGKNTVMGLKLK